MKKTLKEIPGSIVAPKGFRASGVFLRRIAKLGTGKGSNKGPKARPRADCFENRLATVAGMFTTEPSLRRAGENLRRANETRNRASRRGEFWQRQCLQKQARHGSDAREMVSFTERALNFPKSSVGACRLDWTHRRHKPNDRIMSTQESSKRRRCLRLPWKMQNTRRKPNRGERFTLETGCD